MSEIWGKITTNPGPDSFVCTPPLRPIQDWTGPGRLTNQKFDRNLDHKYITTIMDAMEDQSSSELYVELYVESSDDFSRESKSLKLFIIAAMTFCLGTIAINTVPVAKSAKGFGIVAVFVVSFCMAVFLYLFGAYIKFTKRCAKACDNICV